LRTIFIYAGSLAQSEFLCRFLDLNLKTNSVRYLYNVEILLGMRDFTVLKYGTWMHRKDLAQMEEECRYRGGVVLTVTD